MQGLLCWFEARFRRGYSDIMTAMKKLIFSGVAVGIAVFVLFMGLPGERPSPRELYFPWRIEVDADGSSRVFGIRLGESTLERARTLFRDTGDVKLFVSPEGGLSLEAFFDKVELNGIRGKMVLGLDAGERTMRAMLERGTRVKSMADGGRKVSLHPEDLANLLHAPINAITYLPSADPDEAVIRKRFGEPERRIPERDQEGVVHWFYPHLGLDIVLNRNGKDVFQYVAPREFDRLSRGF
uniref:Uncharacterized protein n=1 Tax=Candidatus Kentrum sp. FW TaxID=2126338 RepID=A0A450S466_9GAMM|nr:MAG: hypothetical protein BECKFW1821A_GA0114235_101114 [Candidatus Kentron sp. FW]VFJ46590.1 MAG: hypothetical protein BECKFW1821B_GA0114236_100117 [Candidatus Kentron sp. FW]